MAINFDETVQKLTEFFKTESRTESVIGQSFQLGEFTCVPVIKFGIGLGYGTGEAHGGQPGKATGDGVGGGAGGGIGVEPIGFLATRADQISFIPTRASKGLSAVFEKMPDMLDKMFDKKKEKQEAMA